VNNQGVVGVAPNVKIMALKFLSAGGSDFTSDAIEAIGYAKSKGAKISNNSWGGYGFSQALKDAIDASDSLFVAAAGNGGSDFIGDDNDALPFYPASFASPNILSVAAVDRQGNKAIFSNFGATSVDISAPGEDILSSVPGNSWAYFSGTSMASPHVAGVAGLVGSSDPSLLNDPVALKGQIMKRGKLSIMSGQTVTGKMADSLQALSPWVKNTNPVDNKKGVSAGTNAVATFSLPMESTTVTNTTFHLVRKGTTTKVPATVSYNATTKQATLNPSSNLLPGKTYVATVKGGSTGVKDTQGDAMGTNKVWQFTVAP
jgi:subtilisin family serine protease